MKKFFFVLVALGCMTMALSAAGTQQVFLHKSTVTSRPQASSVVTADNFLRAAQKGDTAALLNVQDFSWLQATDKFGNNCFHLAKDASTLQTLAALVRRLEPKKSSLTITHLRNQRNNMGETPLMAHINYGKTETFQLLYEGSELANAVREAGAVSTGGALLQVAGIKQGVARTLSRDNSGRTVAQAALANRNAPGMEHVVLFFEHNAPYLF